MGTTLIKKHQYRPFLNKGTTALPSWVQIKKATEFTREMNPVTEERDYIADESPTTEVTQYKPSESFAITTYKGEADFDLFYELYKARATGSDAQKEFLLVSIFEQSVVGANTYYYAEKTMATVVPQSFNASSSQLTVQVYENGTSTKGYVTLDSNGIPTFTSGDMPQPPETPVFSNTLEDVSYVKDATANALNGTATVTDGGTISYAWTVNGVAAGTSATYTPDTDTAGTYVVKVTATNTNDGKTSSASQQITVTVTEE